MACFKPLEAIIWKGGGETRRPVFIRKGEEPNLAPGWERSRLPCSGCIGCRIDRQKSWAIRIIHEMKMHESACFVTLTYDEEHLPHDYGLNKTHLQKCIRALRDRGHQLRYYACGEYGDKFSRPHYHAALFGVDFRAGGKLISHGKNALYENAALEKAWGRGFVSVGELDYESAMYVARYVLKKMTGPPAEEHYTRDNPITGNVYTVQPEFSLFSIGLGKEWWAAFGCSDVIPHDNVIFKGREARVPKYYDHLLGKTNPDQLEQTKANRATALAALAQDYTHDRLAAREKVQLARVKLNDEGTTL